MILDRQWGRRAQLPTTANQVEFGREAQQFRALGARVGGKATATAAGGERGYPTNAALALGRTGETWVGTRELTWKLPRIGPPGKKQAPAPGDLGFGWAEVPEYQYPQFRWEH